MSEQETSKYVVNVNEDEAQDSLLVPKATYSVI